MTLDQKKDNIKKLKDVVNSSYAPDKVKDKARTAIAQLQAEVDAEEKKPAPKAKASSTPKRSSAKPAAQPISQKDNLKKIVNFITDKSYFELYDTDYLEDDDVKTVMFETRENGDVGAERHSPKDVAEAKRIITLTREAFPGQSLEFETETVDEWVHLTLTAPKASTKAKAPQKPKQSPSPKPKTDIDKIIEAEDDVLDMIKAASMGEIRDSKTKLTRYATEMVSRLKAAGIKKKSLSENHYDEFVEENHHLLNEFLAWNGYYKTRIEEKLQKSYAQSFDAGSTSTADPDIISLSGSKHKKRPSKGESLLAQIKKDPAFKDIDFSGTSIEIDAKRKARPRGQRISASGKKYTENRENRSDHKQTGPIRLDDGGILLTDGSHQTFKNYYLEKGGATARFEVINDITYLILTEDEVRSQFDDHNEIYVLYPDGSESWLADLNDLRPDADVKYGVEVDDDMYFNNAVTALNAAFGKERVSGGADWAVRTWAVNHGADGGYFICDDESGNFELVHRSTEDDDYPENEFSTIKSLPYSNIDELISYSTEFAAKHKQGPPATFNDGGEMEDTKQFVIERTNEFVAENAADFPKYNSKKPITDFTEAIAHLVAYRVDRYNLSDILKFLNGKMDRFSDKAVGIQDAIIRAGNDVGENNPIETNYEEPFDDLPTALLLLVAEPIEAEYSAELYDMFDEKYPTVYKKGGQTPGRAKDYKYINKSEDYEVRYGKGKNRPKYLKKGGPIGSKTYTEIAKEEGYTVQGDLESLTKPTSKTNFRNMLRATKNQVPNAAHIIKTKTDSSGGVGFSLIHKPVKGKAKNPNHKGNPMFELAKKIRKAGESWPDAKKRAALQLKK